MNKENIDDEFERIIAGQEDLADPDLGSTTNLDSPGAGGKALSDPADTDALTAGALEGQARRIGLVFAPLSPASGVANMLSMYGIARWVVPIAHQTVLYLELEEPSASEENAFDSLLGDDQPMPEEVDRFARILSKLSKHGAIAVVSSLHVEGGATEGNIVARRYVSGQPEENIAAGLLVNSIDVRAEDLLLGRTKPEDYPDAIHPQDRPHPFKRGFGRPFKH